jgi:hypothetical protein
MVSIWEWWKNKGRSIEAVQLPVVVVRLCDEFFELV